MTALPPEGGSFSSCRRSLTRAQPGPGEYVPCRIDVGVHRAVPWTDHGVLSRANTLLPALAAGDARPGWVNQVDRRPRFQPYRQGWPGTEPSPRQGCSCSGRPWPRLGSAETPPAVPGRVWGAGRRVIPAAFRFSSAIASQESTSARAVLWQKSRRRLRTLRHSFARARRSRLRFPDPGLAPGHAPEVRDHLRRLGENTRVGDDLAVGGGQEPDHADIDADRSAQSRGAGPARSRWSR